MWAAQRARAHASQQLSMLSFTPTRTSPYAHELPPAGRKHTPR